jgi:hypothetical protein
MRTLLRVTIPAESGNKAVQDGTIQKVMADTMERLRPEAAYFLAEQGKRSAMFVIDLKDSSDIPSIAEPFFAGFNAAVEFTPVMNAEDLKKGLEKVSRK